MDCLTNKAGDEYTHISSDTQGTVVVEVDNASHSGPKIQSRLQQTRINLEQTWSYTEVTGVNLSLEEHRRLMILMLPGFQQAHQHSGDLKRGSSVVGGTTPTRSCFSCCSHVLDESATSKLISALGDM